MSTFPAPEQQEANSASRGTIASAMPAPPSLASWAEEPSQRRCTLPRLGIPKCYGEKASTLPDSRLAGIAPRVPEKVGSFPAEKYGICSASTKALLRQKHAEQRSRLPRYCTTTEAHH